MASDTKLVQKVDKKKKKKEKKPNIFLRFWRYLKEVWNELKRVTWPNRKELISYTGAVIVFVIIMAVVVGLLDFGFGSAMRLIIGG